MGDDSAGGAGDRTRPRFARALVAAGVGVTLAYLAARRVGSGDGTASIDEIREEVAPGSAGADEKGAEVGGGNGSASGIRQRDFDGAPSDEGGAAAAPAAGVDIGEDRSADEIEQRAASDVQAEPAEPGEMTVDDDVVEDLVGDDDRN